MPYEKPKAHYNALNPHQQLPEFSSFLEDVRFSQVIQEKIKEVNLNLKKLQSEPTISEKANRRLTDIEEQMAELLRIRAGYLKKP